MTFNSAAFLLFLAILLLVYYKAPRENRTLVLLVFSYAFYALYNWKVLPFLILFSILIWFFGRLLGRPHGTVLFAISVIIALLPLGLLKYTGLGSSLVVPLGISYFTFKSVGYLADVHTGKTEAEDSLPLVLAFVGFFPEMLIGPIDRADNLMIQLKGKRLRLSWKLLQRGMLYFLAGCFLKMVLADRLGIIVDTVYGDITIHPGPVVLLAMAAYALQIYFDFAGCSLMALGIGRLLGYKLPENFKRPYLATSVADFWRRWHISLTSWLRDYIYIPLGGNKKGSGRQMLNILVVFLISGIWHGAGFTFVIWGLLNGLFQIVGRLVKPYRLNIYERFSWKEDSLGVVIWQRFWVFVWMMLAWVFFRASSVSEAFSVLHQFFVGWLAGDFGTWVQEMGLSGPNWILLILSLILVFVISILQEQGLNLTKRILRKPFVVRCLVFYLLIFGVLIFGIYGTAYDASSFIYLQF